MKTNMKAIVIAMVLYGMFAGVVSAETPDAGSTWSTARTFALSDGYNFVDGQLTENNPTDIIDCWKSDDASVGSKLELYLNANAYNKFVMAEMCQNIIAGESLMQRLENLKIPGEDNNEFITDTLGSSPVGVRLTNNDLVDIDYTFCVYKN